MILKAFSLLDTKAGIFHAPFFMAHIGQAIRACVDLGSDLQTTVGRHPADFALVEIGTFDDQTGQLDRIPPQQLGTVASMLPQRQQAFPDLVVPAPPAGWVNGAREGA